MRQLFLLLFTFLFACELFSSELQDSHNYTVTEGLAHNGVTCIIEDSKGYFWISTFDGLNRYDGYKFITIKNTIDKKVFPSNRIRTIKEDFNNNLLVGTEDGVSVYNHEMNTFQTIYTNDIGDIDLRGPVIVGILVDNINQRIYCATEESGILVFNKEYNLVDKIKIVDIHGRSEIITNLLLIDSSNLLVACRNRVYSLQTTSKQYEVVLDAAGKKLFASDYKYNEFVRISESKALVCCRRGVEIIEIKNDNGKYSFKSAGQRLSQYFFQHAVLNNNGDLWLGTYCDGVVVVENVDSLLNGKEPELSHFFVPTDILKVSDVYCSKSNGCWVASYNHGIFRFNNEKNAFNWYNTSMKLLNGLVTNSVHNIVPVDQKRCYISANEGNFALYNTQTHRFDPIPFILSSKLGPVIKVILFDSKKNIWINSVEQGLFIVEDGKKNAKKINEKFPEFDRLSVNNIIEDRHGVYWVGETNNLYRVFTDVRGNILDYEKLTNTPIFNSFKRLHVRFIYEDPQEDIIWVGTEKNGLIRIVNDKNKTLNEFSITQFKHDSSNRTSLSSNFASSFVRLPNGHCVVGTEVGGFCKILEGDFDLKFVPITEKNGLSNNVVKNLWYDSNQYLWIATNIGLNKFDTKSNSFRTFTVEEGLPFEEFWYSKAKLANGYTILSGLTGFCYVKPSNIVQKEPVPLVRFTELLIANKTIHPNDTLNGRAILTKPINETEKIELKHNENVITLEVTSLHYANSKNRFIKYQLLPLDKEWTLNSSDQRLIRFHGLPPGDYTLRIMASNSLNEYSVPKELIISIEPPFWKTYKAMILYFIFFMSIGYWIVYFILRIQRLNYDLKIEQLERDKINDVNEAKLRFFSNISHEIKTPLTLIAGPVDLLAQHFKSNPSIYSKISIVQRQSKKISQLIHQVHDFQKANANALHMITTNFAVDVFMTEVIDNFEFFAQNEKKSLVLKRFDENIFVFADRDKLEKILNNILSNSFKYTSEGDSIIVEYYHEVDNLIVKVKDTGKGIDPEDLPHIFERFYQSKRLKNEYIGGSGIGLAFTKRLVEMHYGYITAESELNTGTTITVKLPIIKANANQQQQIEKRILLAEKTLVPKKTIPAKKDNKMVNVDVQKEVSVFVAEDNTEMRLFLQNTLSEFYSIQVFVNGKLCLDAMEQEWPDIVITDVLMPEMNGLELCKNIKSNIKTSHIPVILLTACTAEGDSIKGISDGADAYIHKPFNIDYLITRIEMLIKNRKALQERYRNNLPLTLKKSETSNKDRAFLEKLYNLIEQNIDNQELSLDSFARELYLNRTDFFRKVKALTDHTPYELLRNYRLEKAAELLREEGLSINEVVVMTGYKSRAHFSSSFKKYFEVSPGKYVIESQKSIQA